MKKRNLLLGLLVLVLFIPLVGCGSTAQEDETIDIEGYWLNEKGGNYIYFKDDGTYEMYNKSRNILFDGEYTVDGDHFEAESDGVPMFEGTIEFSGDKFRVVNDDGETIRFEQIDQEEFEDVSKDADKS